MDGYTPRMRVGIHTGRPQRIGSDWLGIDVNIAARVMERATRGELVVSQATLDGISGEDFESLGVEAKRLRRQVFAAKQDGVPADFVMYRLKTRRQLPGDDDQDATLRGSSPSATVPSQPAAPRRPLDSSVSPRLMIAGWLISQ